MASVLCVGLCVSVCSLKRKCLELSTPNYGHIYSVSVTRRALNWRSKGQRSHGYENHHSCMASNEVSCCGCVPLLPVWDAHVIWLVKFLVWYILLYTQILLLSVWGDCIWQMTKPNVLAPANRWRWSLLELCLAIHLSANVRSSSRGLHVLVNHAKVTDASSTTLSTQLLQLTKMLAGQPAWFFASSSFMIWSRVIQSFWLNMNASEKAK